MTKCAASLGWGWLRIDARCLVWRLRSPASRFRLSYRHVRRKWTCCTPVPRTVRPGRACKLGVDESNRQGEFLGVTLNLSRTAGNSVPPTVIAVFAAGPLDVRAVAAAAGDRAVFNLSDSSDALRDACLANALHVVPSERMKSDAVQQWLRRDPGWPGLRCRLARQGREVRRARSQQAVPSAVRGADGRRGVGRLVRCASGGRLP